MLRSGSGFEGCCGVCRERRAKKFAKDFIEGNVFHVRNSRPVVEVRCRAAEFLRNDVPCDYVGTPDQQHRHLVTECPAVQQFDTDFSTKYPVSYASAKTISQFPNYASGAAALRRSSKLQWSALESVNQAKGSKIVLVGCDSTEEVLVPKGVRVGSK